MNLPNLLTLSRVPLLFIIVGLLYAAKSPDFRFPGAASLAFIVFVVAAVTDWLDGYLARKLNQVSNFGKLMDALTDKILMVGMFIVLLVTHILPDWGILCVILIVSREFLITGLRLVAAAEGTVIAAEKGGKQKTVFQIAAICLLLATPMFEYDLEPLLQLENFQITQWLSFLGYSSFIIATALTVSSGTQYILKYKHILFPENEG